MLWYQLTVERCNEDQIQQLSDLVENGGALSVTLTDRNDDPILEPPPGTMPLWPETNMQVLYNKKPEAENALEAIHQIFPDLVCTITVLEEEDWQATLKQEFKPMCFGKRLWVCPSWDEPPEPKAVNLLLDPGLAFGTGTHPTTALCLEWLDGEELQAITAIDFGCGSGILSLAALKLGAKTVYAVDIDEQALEATRQNAENNKIPTPSLLISKPESLKSPTQLIMANILLTPLLQLQETFYHLLTAGGRIIVSGILEEQTEQLIKAYQDLFDVLTIKTKDGWALIAFARRDR